MCAHNWPIVCGVGQKQAFFSFLLSIFVVVRGKLPASTYCNLWQLERSIMTLVCLPNTLPKQGQDVAQV